jgi:hypothetical protein
MQQGGMAIIKEAVWILDFSWELWNEPYQEEDKNCVLITSNLTII